jgi:hypothetical protein
MSTAQTDLKDLQRPLKAGYREDPSKARITLTAKGGEGDSGVASCSVDLGRAIYAARPTSAWGEPGRRRARAICCSARSRPARS